MGSVMLGVDITKELSYSGANERLFFHMLNDELSYKPLWINLDAIQRKSGALAWEIDNQNFELIMGSKPCGHEIWLSDTSLHRERILKLHWLF